VFSTFFEQIAISASSLFIQLTQNSTIRRFMCINQKKRM